MAEKKMLENKKTNVYLIYLILLVILKKRKRRTVATLRVHLSPECIFNKVTFLPIGF